MISYTWGPMEGYWKFQGLGGGGEELEKAQKVKFTRKVWSYM